MRPQTLYRRIPLKISDFYIYHIIKYPQYNQKYAKKQTYTSTTNTSLLKLNINFLTKNPYLCILMNFLSKKWFFDFWPKLKTRVNFWSFCGQYRRFIEIKGEHLNFEPKNRYIASRRSKLSYYDSKRAICGLYGLFLYMKNGIFSSTVNFWAFGSILAEKWSRISVLWPRGSIFLSFWNC